MLCGGLFAFGVAAGDHWETHFNVAARAQHLES